MRQIDFISNEHQKRFEELIEKDRTSIGNNERRQLFYVIAGCDDLWKVKDKIYDFTNHELGMYDPRYLSSSLLNIYLGHCICTTSTGRIYQQQISQAWIENIKKSQ
ncbi:MAG: DUF6075 family protein [Solobacterium sp.]|jgi:hypothetical protein|nr:DUF6075 family protein [Solobacterium sp.]